MAQMKTQPTNASVTAFLDQIKDEKVRMDCFQIVDMMKKASQNEPKMWGSSIVGFGRIHLKYESGRELDWFPIGFSPRKQNLTLYFTGGMDSHSASLKKLGRHTLGSGCLYIKKLADIDVKVLQKMITDTIKTQSRKKT